MAKPLDTNRVVAEVLAGHHDEQIDEILQAVTERVRKEVKKPRWRMTFEDLVVTEDDLTLGECAEVEAICGVPWTKLRPSSTANQARAVLIVALMKRKGLSASEAKERVDALPQVTGGDLFDIYLVDPSPLDNPDPS